MRGGAACKQKGTEFVLHLKYAMVEADELALSIPFTGALPQ